MSAEIYAGLAARRPDLVGCLPALEAACDLLTGVFESGGKLLVCGNGGSASDSEHIVGELMKGFLSRRPLGPEEVAAFEKYGAGDLGLALQGALPAVSLASHLALITAVGNDMAPDMAFAQQVWGLGRPGDALLGLSTSGNSRNVVNAFTAARVRGMKTIALIGRGGALSGLADVVLSAPADTVYEIQEMHLPLYHTLCLALEARLFKAPQV